MILKRRKNKHVTKVENHIFALHMKLTRETRNIDELKGKELNQKVKELQSISSRMKEYRKYLKLVLL